MTTIQKTADAIVVVNPKGIAVDSNNAFAQMCGVPAGLIVGRPLERFAPELARELDTISEAYSDTTEELSAVRTPAGEFGLDVQPLAATASSTDADRVVTLRASELSGAR